MYKNNSHSYIHHYYRRKHEISQTRFKELPFDARFSNKRVTLANVAVDPPMFMVEPPVESVDRVLDRAAAPVDILFPPRTTSWSTIT